MTEWKVGLVVAPVLIIAMAILLYRKRAIARSTLILVISMTVAIVSVLFTT